MIQTIRLSNKWRFKAKMIGSYLYTRNLTVWYRFTICVWCVPMCVSFRYYAEYYQQYQQLAQYPQYSTVHYPAPSPLAAVSAIPTLSAVPAALDPLRPVLPAAPVPAAAAIAMATSRVYEPPPIPPPRKEPLLRRSELALHPPETPFR